MEKTGELTRRELIRRDTDRSGAFTKSDLKKLVEGLYEEPTKPKCEICETENKEYCVYQGVTITTAMAPPPPYWDEAGKYIVPPDPNSSSTEYSCSNGHKWRA